RKAEQGEHDLAQELEREIDNDARAGHTGPDAGERQFARASDLTRRRQKRDEVADAFPQPARPQADQNGAGRRVEDHDAPGDCAKEKADEIDADQRGESLPADGERGIDDLAPAEMGDEDGRDRESEQRADDEANSHETAAR